MVRDQREYSATFLGVSFFERLDGTSLQTSSAQLFDERGEGLILKGGPGLKDKTDRQQSRCGRSDFVAGIVARRTPILAFQLAAGRSWARERNVG
jgi:hypothetical protein